MNPVVVGNGFGDEAKMIVESLSSATSHYTEPISQTLTPQKFARLAATWEHDNALLSSIKDMALLPAYQEIIGMGERAIPLILRQMQARPDHWFWALKAISGENPVKEEHRGDFEKMTQDWIEWGKQKGYMD